MLDKLIESIPNAVHGDLTDEQVKDIVSMALKDYNNGFVEDILQNLPESAKAECSESLLRGAIHNALESLANDEEPAYDNLFFVGNDLRIEDGYLYLPMEAPFDKIKLNDEDISNTGKGKINSVRLKFNEDIVEIDYED